MNDTMERHDTTATRGSEYFGYDARQYETRRDRRKLRDEIINHHPRNNKKSL